MNCTFRVGRASAVALMVVGGCLVAAPGAGAASGGTGANPVSFPVEIASATVRQTGTRLTWSVRTTGEWAAPQLTSGSFICVNLAQGRGASQVCATTRDKRLALTVARTGAGDQFGAPAALKGTVFRSGRKALEARFAYADAGVQGGALRFQTVTQWRDTGACKAPAAGKAEPCTDASPVPGGRLAITTVAKGCTPLAPGQRFNGPRTRRVVALTFDDGPNPPYTGQVLDILKRKGVKATFFLIGQQVRGNAGLVRRELSEGHIIGNHTFTHANVSGGNAGQLTSTTNVIRSVTGYTPCVFRPPYGATSPTLAAQAFGLGMNTINWDVDPTDWKQPGADAVYSRVVGGAQAGSIILMHDGGGPRGGTVAALPRIIDTLRSRGYSFATVPELLGLKPTF
jgi:peptidoglycan/xylan/chitin deacetylase (PgdA/CDA1 family)